MNGYALIFLAGLAGSMHCVGMCGGFVCALGGNGDNSTANILRHLLYNTGRIATYGFIGAFAGQLGILLSGYGGEGSWASYGQRVLACLAGLLMVVAGLQFLGRFKTSRHLPGVAGEALIHSMQQLLTTRDRRAPLVLGVLNGFLPCPLVYAFVAQAASSGGALPGVLVMLVFGLGTFPAMLAMGAIGLRLHHSGMAWRITGIHLAGVFIVLLGFITFVRGVLPMAPHLHVT